jgi:fatty-acyl-CoA synthase
VAIDLWNCPQNVETIFASFKLRAVPFNINYRFRENELVHMLTDSHAAVVVFDATLAERVLAAAERVDHDPVLVQVGGTEVAGGVLDFEVLIASHEPAPRIERDGDDELIIYTGGTTGYPKGVVWAHNMFGQQMLSQQEIETLADYAAYVAEAERVGLSISPLMHMTGFAVTIGTLNGGGGVVFCTSRSLDPDEILRLIGEYRIKNVMMIGDAFAKPILDALNRARAEGRPYDLSSVETVGNVGLMMSAPVKKGLLEHGSFLIRDGIGATEGGQFATIESKEGEEIETAKFKLGPSARVIGEDGKDVVPGSGQIGYLAAGGRLPKGYLNDPEKSEKTWPTIDGVRYSMPGDMATVEADGTITLLGRGSEVVNSGGEKIFVEEVEQAILTHSAVREVMVVGVPDDRFGSRVAAVVALEPGAELGYEQLREHVGSQLADHKRPRQVVFVDEVPRSPNGKNDRKRAKEIAVEASSEMAPAS